MLVAFSITPIGVGESVGAEVAEVVRLVRASGLPNETGPMFTTVEGEWDQVMPLIRRCMDAVAASAPRVSVSIKIDERHGVQGALEGKVTSVERRLAGDHGDHGSSGGSLRPDGL